jgi:hypothetical protein
MSISDSDLLEKFEALNLSPDELNHSNHLRIAWLYLNKYSLKEAIDKTGTGTKEFAESLGDTEKYHQTITEATVRIMDKRMSNLQAASFEEFLQDNKDLVQDLKSVMHFHYNEEVLESTDAKLNFIQPDKRGFEQRA